MKAKDWFIPFSWFMVVALFAITFFVNPMLGINSPHLVFFCTLPLVLVHGIRRYGLKGMGIFAAVTYIISTFWESLSIHTGFPFGDYYYTPHPQILGVAIFIGPAYISLGYMSWQVANSILQEADTRISRFSSALLVSVFSAIAMTVYDLATDVQASTVGHSWIWEKGGEFFGVPVSNFLGWWFCTFSFYLLFALFLKKNPDTVKEEKRKTPLFQFILIYINLGLTVLISYILKISYHGTATDLAGTTWKLSDISGSSLLWVVFGMFPLALMAIINLYRIGLPDRTDSK